MAGCAGALHLHICVWIPPAVLPSPALSDLVMVWLSGGTEGAFIIRSRASQSCFAHHCWWVLARCGSGTLTTRIGVGCCAGGAALYSRRGSGSKCPRRVFDSPDAIASSTEGCW